ncbi:hypothetical protein GCM10011365_24910 [Marinicella pacifica]|uniref:Calcineurin-like phosphoesterase domain-containing protein n=2 Tax=Marinicella pacifica TaxID=1171543 RepID=A0A917FT40_9GAMM|nr:hypothetical protein GCM10011365_24910 [Marinicella pacifica]
MNMKRRAFLKATVAAGSAPLILSACTDQNISHSKDANSISGFIFSDAHIGWEHEMQPSLETQAEMIKRIKEFFPHLDLVFDTGDVYHAHIKEPGRKIARDFWLSKMAGEFPTSLVHYIPGNHELGVGLKDAEITASELGSMNLRPYYSFDYKGIHFISLPQLLSTILISRESLNWLKQDLLINREKTTLIFSHNCLKETTFTNDETGYREIVNSDEVYKIINEYNNVIGWFHGHNHQYEIVKKHERLYVSNGRIGGFNPPKHWGDFGQGHLGGIYFEINHIGLNVKCFSATENCFLEDLGLTHLSNHLPSITSYQPDGKTNYYWGHGKLLNDTKHHFHNHYLGHTTPYAIITPNPNTVINENNDLTYETEFFFAGSDINKVVGFVIKPGALKSIDTKDGLMINTLAQKKFQIHFPEENYLYDTYLSRSGYYRCSQNCTYELVAKFSNLNDDTRIKYSFKVLDIEHNVCFKQDKFKSFQLIDNRLQTTFKIPDKMTQEPADNHLYLFITIEVTNPPDNIFVQYINLNQIIDPDKVKPKLFEINNSTFPITEKQTITKSKSLMSPTGIINVQDNNTSHTLLVVTPDVQWQIRNACAELFDDEIHIHSMRHDFQNNPEIILTPTTQKSTFINRLKNITSCKIIYKSDSIIVSDITSSADGGIILISDSSDVSVSNGEIIHKTPEEMHITLNKDISEVTLQYNKT